jgi:hypothetical protein
LDPADGKHLPKKKFDLDHPAAVIEIHVPDCPSSPAHVIVNPGCAPSCQAAVSCSSASGSFSGECLRAPTAVA